MQTQDKPKPILVLGQALRVAYVVTQELRTELTKDYADKTWDERDPDTIKKIIETERHILNAIYTIAEVAVDYHRDEREFGFAKYMPEPVD